MKIAYIAGPYRSKTEWDLVQNIRCAEAVAIKYWMLGYATICPHKNTAHLGGVNGIDDSVWLEGDLEMLRRSDVVVMLPTWKNSQGATAELELAQKLGKEVIFEN